MENKEFEQQAISMYLLPQRVPLSQIYSRLKATYERLGQPVPSLSSIRRKVRALPPEVISAARG